MMTEEMKPTICEFASGKTTDRKLNRDNFLQRKRVVGIHVTGRVKDYHLTNDSSDSQTQISRHDHAFFLGQILKT